MHVDSQNLTQQTSSILCCARWKSSTVTLLCGDVTEIELGENAFELWHDRAVFHFLTDAGDRDRYRANLCRALRPGGHVIIGTFAPGAPPRCSGLPVQRYDLDLLHETLGDAFELRRHQQEVFACLFLDNRHRLIRFEELFRGTVNGASVHPREIAKRALHHNAAAVIIAHNHPSGVAEPSLADRTITRRIRDAMGLIDVRLMDHLVVGDGEIVSFAERGWI